jgi:hypothetical protein
MVVEQFAGGGVEQENVARIGRIADGERASIRRESHTARHLRPFP